MVENGNRPPLLSNSFTRKLLNGLVAGLMVRRFCRIAAHVWDGMANELVMQGTLLFVWLRSPAIISCWPLPRARVSGVKILLLVSSGTAFCSWSRRPSYDAKKKVLSFLSGKPKVAPYCWRL